MTARVAGFAALLVSLGVAAPSQVGAQEGRAPQPGDSVRLTIATSTRPAPVRGRLLEVAVDSLLVAQHGRDDAAVWVERSALDRLEVWHSRHPETGERLLRGVLIGVGVGALAGFAVAKRGHGIPGFPPVRHPTGWWTLFGAGLGGGVGLFVGSILSGPGWHVVAPGGR